MKTNQMKILSVLLALILALSALTVLPVSAAAAEIEAPVQSGDSPYSGLTLDAGRLYFDAASAGWSYSGRNKVAFYICDDQDGEIISYGNKHAIGTAIADAEGIFEYDVAANAGVTLTPGVQYQIRFYAADGNNWGACTYPVYFTADCLGHVAYATGKNIENEVYGFSGTEAQRYADKYGFTFRMIVPATSDEVSVDAPEGYTYSVVKKATDDEASPDEASPDEAAPVDKEQLPEGSIVLSVYDITLRNKGDETPVQPESPVTVRIRCDNPDAHVFRREADGTLTDMHARYENGYLVYEADRFSVYPVVQLGAEVDPAICGDADGDGDVTIIDVTLLLRYVAQMDVDIPESTLMRGDADGNGELEITDAVFISRWLTNIEIPYPPGDVPS